MKYTVLGFSQKRVVELGLSIDELLVLRWFVDFYGSKSMVKLSTDEGVYAWVNYKSLLDDMPIITCNKRHLAERFKKLSDVGVLKHKTIRQGGIFSAFAFGPEYQSLVADTKLQDLGGDSPKTDVPTSENGHILRPKTDEQNINLQEDPSTKYSEPPNPPTQKTKVQDVFFGHDFSEPLKAKLTEWLAYKAEKRDSYKPTGLKSFMTVISNKLKIYSEADIIALIDDCMANNWQGIIWDRLKGKEDDKGRKDDPTPWV